MTWQVVTVTGFGCGTVIALVGIWLDHVRETKK